MTEFAALRPKTYSYLTDDGDEDKKGKSTKKCFIKQKLKFEDYKHCLKVAQLKIIQLEKNKIHVDSLRENNKEIHRKQ